MLSLLHDGANIAINPIPVYGARGGGYGFALNAQICWRIPANF